MIITAKNELDIIEHASVSDSHSLKYHTHETSQRYCEFGTTCGTLECFSPFTVRLCSTSKNQQQCIC